ncbi:hypothetical protein P879_00140 [Paragonimus westermani]|uniref:Reticulocalbin-3 n=1 Tax=Paragonimus westermani TaxID=34504 RepID=A0A8T0E157_9TREM|nr:hypothetical protein P879_00140 [Paragonimus westermani]
MFSFLRLCSSVIVLALFYLVVSKAQSNSEFENLDTLMNDPYLRPDDPQLPIDSSHFDTFGSHDSEFDHELVTGSVDEARYFKQLEPQEAKERLGKLFDKMDTSHDEKLDKEELINWIIQSLTQLDLEAIRGKFKDHDANHDGTVTWNEFTSKVYGYSEKELVDLKKDTGQDTQDFIRSLEEEKVRFDSADVDQNSGLNETEYAAFEHPHNYRHMAAYELIHTLRDFDKDGDGMISQKEYLADDKMHKDAFLIEKENFKRYDQNRDGMLDKEEMKQWVTPGFQRTAADEAEHLFTETDTNKDDELTKDEVLAQHDLWVGSQATDYGRHLDTVIKDEL